MPEFKVMFDVYGDDEKKKGEIRVNHEKGTIEVHTAPVRKHAKKVYTYQEVFDKLMID